MVASMVVGIWFLNGEWGFMEASILGGRGGEGREVDLPVKSWPWSKTSLSPWSKHWLSWSLWLWPWQCLLRSPWAGEGCKVASIGWGMHHDCDSGCGGHRDCNSDHKQRIHSHQVLASYQEMCPVNRGAWSVSITVAEGSLAEEMSGALEGWRLTQHHAWWLWPWPWLRAA